MAHISYTDLRQNLAHYMDEAVQTRAALVVTRQRGKGNIVLLAEEEYEGLMETIHLLRSPANAARLLASVRQARAGEAEERPLVMPAASPEAA